MKPDISEFSYGFALTSELVQSYALQGAGAPIFPSLRAEGSTGGGFDVRLPGLPVFLQFKLSDCLTTRHAAHRTSLGVPYYRFKIRALKYSIQHDLLLALEAQGNAVFYAAPRFHTPDELNEAFANSRIVDRSAFVSPASVGRLPDAEEHSVSFAPTGLLGIFRSDPRDIEMSDPETIFGPQRRQQPGVSDQRGLRDLGDQLIDLYASQVPEAEADRARRLRAIAREREPSDYARFVALALFDSELLFVPEHSTATGKPSAESDGAGFDRASDRARNEPW